MKMNVLPYEAWHGESILNWLSMSGLNWYVKDYTTQIATPEMSYSLEVDDQIIGCAGVLPVWNGVGEAWTMLSERVRKEFSLTMHREVRRIMIDVCERKKLHRLYCHVLTSYDAGHRWAKALGFKNEGTMKYFGPNKETMDRYAITFER